MTVRTDNDVLLARRCRCCNHRTGKEPGLVMPYACAFTLLEVLMVLAILVIAAVAAIPLISSAGSVTAQAAADMLTADLAYAKSMAVSRGQTYAVVFDVDAETYAVKDQGGTVIDHPIKKGFSYVVDFANDSRFADVDIATVSFNGTSAVKFDYLGSPYDADDTDLASPGTVTLTSGSMTWTVSVEPVTGQITKSSN